MQPLQELKDTLLLLPCFPIIAFAAVGTEVVIDHPHLEGADAEVDASTYQAEWFATLMASVAHAASLVFLRQ